jgi:uncharacterized protein (TIGR03435 family)
MRILQGKIVAGGSTLAQFANALSRLVGRIVVDQTQLTGGFDLDLTWTPDQSTPGLPPADASLIDPNAPSIFTAVQEQLGLKLVATRGAVDVIVIDSVELPTPD